MAKTSNTFNGISNDPDAPINWELDYCEKCHQMTNHNGNGKCLKCSSKSSIKINSQESLNVEKLDEMPDYETTDRVVARDTRIPSNDNNIVIHPDSLIKKRTHRKCDDKYFDELNKDELDS